MSTTLTEAQQLVADAADRVGRDFPLDYWRELDAHKAFPTDFWKAVCQAGLAGVALDEEWGGAGLGMFEMALIVERLAAAAGGSTVAQLFMLNPIFGGVAVQKFGSPEMKQALLPGLISGEVQFCLALTEPDAGSNSLAITTTADRDGAGWRLNGRKIWITGVPNATKMLVVARTTPASQVQRRTQGLSLFLVDVERQGLTHHPIEKLGTNTLPSSSVYFEDVPVQEGELLGTLDGGWPELLDVLNTERIVTTAGLVGTCELAFRLAVEYANQRRVFGATAIGSYQGLQFPLAQAYAEAESARLMNRHAASLFDAGLPYGSEANIAKLIGAQAASAATERAMQTLGGMGYARESHLERLWRDCRLFRFAPVSEEMILNYIASHDLGMARSY